MNLQGKMVETRVWKVSRRLTCADDKCRLCGEHRGTVYHLLAGRKLLAGNDYLTRHNRALVTLAVQWVKEFELMKDGREDTFSRIAGQSLCHQ